MKKANTRIRRSREQWQILIDRQQTSDLSTREFCRRNALNYNVFCKWRRRLTATEVQPDNLIDITELVKASPAPTWDIELALGDGMVLRLRRG